MATEKDNVNTGLLGTIAAVMTFATVGIALAVTALVRSSEEDQVATKSADMHRPYEQARKQQQAELGAPAAWADKDKGTVSVPIERAMAMVVKGLREDPSTATAPTPPPKPAADAGVDGESADGAEAGAEAAEASAEGADGQSAPGDPGSAAPDVESAAGDAGTEGAAP